MKGSASDSERIDASSTSEADAIAAYREQIECWAHALSTGDVNRLQHAVEEGVRGDQVVLFVDGNMQKRFLLLLQLLEFVAPALDDFENLVDEFVAQHPFAALDSGTQDADKCLAWIERTQQLTPEQQDYVSCQRARHAVELLGAERRLEHVRFHEVRSLTPELLRELETNDRLVVHVNPVLAWTRFHTPALLENDVSLPSDVVFHATGGGIRTSVVNDTAKLLLAELTEQGPMTLDAWALRTAHSDRAGLVVACRELAELELIALC